MVRLLSVWVSLLAVAVMTVPVGAGEVPDGFTLVYEQDFSDEQALGDFAFASADDFRRVDVDGRWAMEYGNESRQSDYAPPHRSPLYIGLIKGMKLGSFVLEYEVQQRSRTGNHRDHCVFFNFIDPVNFYYTHIAKAADPHSHQVMLVDDAPRTAITEEGTDGYDWGPLDDWHSVRVERDLESGRIAVYVEDMDEPVLTTTNDEHGAGFVGFGSFDDLGRVTDIKLWAEDVEETDEAPFE